MLYISRIGPNNILRYENILYIYYKYILYKTQTILIKILSELFDKNNETNYCSTEHKT